MTYKGIAKGKTIELEALLPYPEGQPVSVWVQPLSAQSGPGSPAAIRQVMHEPPHLIKEDVDELEGAQELKRRKAHMDTLAGCISDDEARQILDIIEEEFEQVNPDEWR